MAAGPGLQAGGETPEDTGLLEPGGLGHQELGPCGHRAADQGGGRAAHQERRGGGQRGARAPHAAHPERQLPEDHGGCDAPVA
eukprot:15473290-Alexandrium_andersonii.AAC.1